LKHWPEETAKQNRTTTVPVVKNGKALKKAAMMNELLIFKIRKPAVVDETKSLYQKSSNTVVKKCHGSGRRKERL